MSGERPGKQSGKISVLHGAEVYRGHGEVERQRRLKGVAGGGVVQEIT